MTKPRPRFLLVDDNEEAGRLLGEILERESYEVIQTTSVATALKAYREQGPFAAVLTDLRMPEASGLTLVRKLREVDPDVLLFVLTAFGDAATAGEAIRAGAHDFISKPFDVQALRQTIARALERRRTPVLTPRASEAAPDVAVQLEETVVGHSPAIIDVMKTVARVAPTQATVLIRGETGTGKELIARTIHRYSTRSERRFVAVNCSALAEGILESELFGHIRGAFTGATATRPGLFREADKGTIFLDEIGDISPAMQARLLRVLQEQEILPVGSEAPVKVDVRVLAATHRNLDELVRSGAFRADLYYRLNVVTIELPPLRERRQDLPLLIHHLLVRLATRHRRELIALDPEAEQFLMQYDWPGNIRELHNVLERAVVLAEQGVIGPEHLTNDVRMVPSLLSGTAPSGGSDTELVPLAEIERRHVLKVLAAMNGNREQAARVLRISRRTLTRMLQRWSGKRSS